MLFIFSNSLKNSEESKADSDIIVNFVRGFLEKLLPNNELDLNFIVRKCAHFAEFFALGLCASVFALQISKKRSLSMILVSIYVILVAFGDEFIQSFTGRSSKITDVLIDLCGAFAGIAAVLLIEYLIKYNSSKKTD
jgi:VanZ family protein